GRELQADRQARVQDGADPPPLRAQGLGRTQGHRALLDHQLRPGPPRAGHAEAAVMLGALTRFRRALVVGCGQSGVAAAELLHAAGCEVRLYDRRSEVAGLPARLADCPRFFGDELAPDEAFADLDLLLLSPGVPPAPWRARHRMLVPEAEIHGELSLALAAIAEGWDGGVELPTVLITGTNGKSTVTALTGAMLEAGGLAPFVGGNLGIPLAQLVLDVL